ncbi:MAG: hypothetical protein J6Y87_08775, partial [Muribaculaceae bacterium]|nr:hypothetical protein [Muribaculaceae bacterium]
LKRFVSSTQDDHRSPVQTPGPLTQGARSHLASCTTSVYVNLSKNSFPIASALDFCAKAGAKVLLFSEPTKLFGKNFKEKSTNPASLDENQETKLLIPYYII